VPAANVVAVRPPGMNRAATIRMLPWRCSILSACLRRFCPFSPWKSLPAIGSPIFEPKK